MERVRVYEKKTEKIYIAEIDRRNGTAIVIRNGKRDEMTLVQLDEEYGMVNEDFAAEEEE